jgi:hypothetical protein
MRQKYRYTVTIAGVLIIIAFITILVHGGSYLVSRGDIVHTETLPVVHVSSRGCAQGAGSTFVVLDTLHIGNTVAVLIAPTTQGEIYCEIILTHATIVSLKKGTRFKISAEKAWDNPIVLN